MRFLVIADGHENMKGLEKILLVEKGIDYILNLGDFRNDRDPNTPQDYGYRDFGVPMYAINGNHEVEQVIEDMRKGSLRIPNFNLLMSGNTVRLREGNNILRIAGLCGVYSPNQYTLTRRWADTRFFVEEEVNKIKSAGLVDIFLSHECSEALGLKTHKGNMGIPVIDEIIAAIHPKIAFSGHHHIYHENAINFLGHETKLIGLEDLNKGYLVMDYAGQNFDIQRRSIILENQGFRPK